MHLTQQIVTPPPEEVADVYQNSTVVLAQSSKGGMKHRSIGFTPGIAKAASSGSPVIKRKVPVTGVAAINGVKPSASRIVPKQTLRDEMRQKHQF